MRRQGHEVGHHLTGCLWEVLPAFACHGSRAAPAGGRKDKSFTAGLTCRVTPGERKRKILRTNPDATTPEPDAA